jgi:uncharacterized protein (DUF302 family)
MPNDAINGIINLSSPWEVSETVSRLESVFAGKKIKVFARIDQAAEAAAAGLKLRPTVLLIFGDPAKGTPLMEKFPTMAIDLPLKALVWESRPGEVEVSLSTPEFYQERHQLPFAPFSEVIQLITVALTS